MKIENQLLEKFQVEELEKRFEFKWISEVAVSVPVEGQTLTVTVNP